MSVGVGDEGLPDPEVYEAARRIDEKRWGYRFVKRAFDILLSFSIIVIGAVPGMILSIAIMKSTGGSPIYSQTRVGKYGKPFEIYKFRSMVADSDDVEKYFSSEQLKLWNKEKKVDNDPRITPLGSFLRRTSLDEFPNFINVLLGQMSTIGPRAISYAELDEYEEMKAKFVSVTPGITGWWQVTDRNKATYETGVRQQLELFYIENASTSLDARIFLLTFRALFSRTGK